MNKLSLCFIILLNGCLFNGSDSLEDCATSYTGTFSGDLEGLATTRIRLSGEMNVFFENSDINFSEEVEIETDNTFTGNVITGEINLDECALNGTWNSNGSSGTFLLEKAF